MSYSYSTPTCEPFNKEEYNKFIKYFEVINGYFMRLIKEDYEFGYRISLNMDCDRPNMSATFISKEIGELEMCFHDWTDKLIIRDYRKHKMKFFNDAESLIAYFKKVYLPILEAEEIIANGTEIEEEP